MAGILQHLRSSTLDKRPNPASMVDGQVAINYASGAPGMFFKNSNGDLVKVGPVHVGSSAPNASPASGGTAGNSIGEQWLDNSGGTYVFKIWDGSAWRSEAGEFVNTTGDTMTGALILPSGTAAAPALGVGSTDNGLYSPGADQVAISTNGTGRLFVDANGNIGVGQASPAVYFDIFKSGVNQADLRVRNGTSGLNLAIKADGTADISNVLDYPITFTTGTTPSEKLRITSAGLVGIGTSVPTSLLSVGNASSHSIGLSSSASFYGAGSQIASSVSTAGVFSTETAAVDVGAVLAFGGRTGNAAPVYPFAFIQGAKASATAGDYSGYLRFLTVPADGGIPVERLRISETGRVGIGTTGPTSEIHLAKTGASDEPTLRIQSENSSIYLRTAGSSGSFPTGGGGNDGELLYLGGDFRVGTGSSSKNVIFINGSTYQERARIDSSGRLLVGTSSSTNVNTRAVFQGYASSTNEYAIVCLKRGDDPAVAGSGLGVLSFGNKDADNVAAIGAYRDTGTWTHDSSQPTRLVFSVTADGAPSPTEAMRIDSSQNVLVGTADTNPAGNNTNGAAISGGGRISAQVSGDHHRLGRAQDGTIVAFHSAGGAEGSISISGAITSYNTSSDYRLKENVVDLDGAITRVKQLAPKRFNFIINSERTIDGFLAHEAATVVPEAVTGTKDEVDDDGNPVMQGIDQSKLVPLLTAALQEAIGEIESLKTRVAALESA